MFCCEKNELQPSLDAVWLEIGNQLSFYTVALSPVNASSVGKKENWTKVFWLASKERAFIENYHDIGHRPCVKLKRWTRANRRSKTFISPNCKTFWFYICETGFYETFIKRVLIRSHCKLIGCETAKLLVDVIFVFALGALVASQFQSFSLAINWYGLSQPRGVTICYWDKYLQRANNSLQCWNFFSHNRKLLRSQVLSFVGICWPIDNLIEKGRFFSSTVKGRKTKRRGKFYKGNVGK